MSSETVLIVQVVSGLFVLGAAAVTGYWAHKASQRAAEATETASEAQAEVTREGAFMESMLKRIDQAEEDARECRAENVSLRRELDQQQEEIRGMRTVLDDLSRKQRSDAYLITQLRDYIGNLRAYIVGMGAPIPVPPFGVLLDQQEPDSGSTSH